MPLVAKPLFSAVHGAIEPVSNPPLTRAFVGAGGTQELLGTTEDEIDTETEGGVGVGTGVEIEGA
jgi:hypothetical protein